MSYWHKALAPGEDAELVRRLKAAGAIILGKTGTHELAYGTTSDNAFCHCLEPVQANAGSGAIMVG